MAILSWRWDGDIHSSRNIASAVHAAKTMSIKYLFVDQVSIDQTLDGDALIEKIQAFSKLYTALTVIVAYDKIDEDFTKTVHRPWIFYEMRLYRYNPGQVIYVSHCDQGTEYLVPKDRYLGTNFWGYRFCSYFMLSWMSSFMTTIFHILRGSIHMTSISDLKFIMPPYARILSTAYEIMARNDYLLTAGLLYGACTDTTWSLPWNIRTMNYRRYRFKSRMGPTFQDHSSLWTKYDIYLDGIKVAEWERNLLEVESWYTLSIVQGADQAVLKALALNDSEFLREYSLQEEARCTCLRMPHENRVPLPTVKLASVIL
ncbi:hypothetical protein BDV26DRAFT_198700 [Aspergillus bertholletiae]|uniref:Heterokaryon incompatibility domain-containing protein n=1 Tax=Aspergillus bertholletiae TaxID=1226010 RepID=A0A5N7B8P3_9EURO|nr:hypothetical protein BDV26DRAFT_198700 [Aspergillus bertholletiae]